MGTVSDSLRGSRYVACSLARIEACRQGLAVAIDLGPKMMSGIASADRPYMAFASLVIIAVLGIQTVVGFTFHRADYWPFVSYPMYSTANFDGQHLEDYRLLAETGSGDRVALNAEDFGYSFWVFRKNVHEAIRAGRLPASLVSAACDRHGDLRELVLEDTGYFITRNGPESGPSREIARISVACADQESDR
jgi:hypothetical protein